LQKWRDFGRYERLTEPVAPNFVSRHFFERFVLRFGLDSLGDDRQPWGDESLHGDAVLLLVEHDNCLPLIYLFDGRNGDGF